MAEEEGLTGTTPTPDAETVSRETPAPVVDGGLTAEGGNWYDGIEDEGIRALAGKFEKKDDFQAGLKAVGVEFGEDGKPVPPKVPEGAPEKYADFQLPENTEVKPEALDKFREVAKKLDLPQEKAQELLTFQMQSVNEFVQDTTQQFKALSGAWLAEAKADEKIGGVNFNKNLEAGKRVLKQLGTPELVKVLDVFGLGNHPEMIRFTSKIGKMIGEDGIVTGGAGGGEKSLADRLYPSMGKSA